MYVLNVREFTCEANCWVEFGELCVISNPCSIISDWLLSTWSETTCSPFAADPGVNCDATGGVDLVGTIVDVTGY